MGALGWTGVPPRSSMSCKSSALCFSSSPSASSLSTTVLLCRVEHCMILWGARDSLIPSSQSSVCMLEASVAKLCPNLGQAKLLHIHVAECVSAVCRHVCCNKSSRCLMHHQLNFLGLRRTNRDWHIPGILKWGKMRKNREQVWEITSCQLESILCHRVQTGTGAHPVSFAGSKVAWTWG
jgi:hypothetical protein